MRGVFKTGTTFLQRVKRGLKYFKLGYNSYDFDYIYLLDLMKFKLNGIHDSIEQSPFEGTEYTLSRIKLIIRLLDLYSKDYYSESYYDSLQEDYGMKRGFDIDSVGNLVTKYESEDEYQIAKEQYAKYDEYKLKDKKCLELALKLLNHRIETFWN